MILSVIIAFSGCGIMRNDQELIEISKFVLELTATDGMGNDLDSLLARLFTVLEKLTSFHIQPKGVIRMYNPRGRLVTVAQHGFQPIWQNSLADACFSEVPHDSSTEAFVAPLSTTEQVFVLPLTCDKRPLGQVVILIAPGWTPRAAKMEFMTNLAWALSGLVSRCLMKETLLLREIELEDACTQAIRRLGTASEYRDNETGTHVMRMTSIAVVIAKALGLPEKQRELLFITAPMHDVGKIGIADAILLKPGRLTADEFEVIKTHTEIGERLLHGTDSLIEAARDIALTHHENWDGSGYPRGLKEEEIPILARICAIADVFDALTSARPYKNAWPVEQAIDWIVGEAGKKFDPAAVKAFETALPEILRIRELYREDIINPNQVLKLPAQVCHDTRWVSWDASLSVGIDVIDEHHRYLFDLTNDLIDVIANRLGAKELVRVFNALSQYAQVHFRAEERMMEHYGYDGTDLQKQQHQQFHDKLKEFYDELHDNPLIARIEVMTYLREWLGAHIRHEDTRLRSLVD
jgi:hemerythrin-like metal-binding protein